MITLGEILLTINGSSCSFQVVPDKLPLPGDGILGMPFLKDSAIYLKEKEIQHPLGTFPFPPENLNTEFLIRDRTKQFVRISVANPEIKEGYLPLIDLGPGIFLGEVLVKVKDGKLLYFV